jgi:hypothetical protein
MPLYTKKIMLLVSTITYSKEILILMTGMLLFVVQQKPIAPKFSVGNQGPTAR